MTAKKNTNSEKALIEALRNGSTEAFDSLYHVYFQRVYAYCFQFAKNHDDAADWTQEVFVGLWRSRNTIKRTDSLNSLLFSMARNRLISAYRTKVNSEIYKEYIDFRSEPAAPDHCRMEYAEFVERVRRCMGKLPPQQAKILRMSRFKNMSIGEIANKLHIEPQTVRNQLSLAVKAMRTLLGPLGMMLFFS